MPNFFPILRPSFPRLQAQDTQGGESHGHVLISEYSLQLSVSSERCDRSRPERMVTSTQARIWV